MNQKEFARVVEDLLNTDGHFASVTKHNHKTIDVLCDDGHRYRVSLVQKSAPKISLTQDR